MASDSNFCVECNNIEEFETIGDDSTLYCTSCGWELNEIQAAIACENWEPPDPPGWEGGFADNH